MSSSRSLAATGSPILVPAGVFSAMERSVVEPSENSGGRFNGAPPPPPVVVVCCNASATVLAGSECAQSPSPSSFFARTLAIRSFAKSDATSAASCRRSSAYNGSKSRRACKLGAHIPATALTASPL